MLVFDIAKPKPVIGQASIQIDRPVTEVFDYVAVQFFHNYPNWALEVSEFKPLDGYQVMVGAKATQTRLDQGQKTTSTFQIVAFEPLKQLTFQGVSDPYRDSYSFASAADNQMATLLTFSFELFELELFMRPFEKLIRRAIEEGARNNVQNIKNLLS